MRELEWLKDEIRMIDTYRCKESDDFLVGLYFFKGSYKLISLGCFPITFESRREKKVFKNFFKKINKRTGYLGQLLKERCFTQDNIKRCFTTVKLTREEMKELMDATMLLKYDKLSSLEMKFEKKMKFEKEKGQTSMNKYKKLAKLEERHNQINLFINNIKNTRMNVTIRTNTNQKICLNTNPPQPAYFGSSSEGRRFRRLIKKIIEVGRVGGTLSNEKLGELTDLQKDLFLSSIFKDRLFSDSYDILLSGNKLCDLIYDFMKEEKNVIENEISKLEKSL